MTPRLRRTRYVLVMACALCCATLAGCLESTQTPRVQRTCTPPAPQLAGVWTGHLQDRQLWMSLDERCPTSGFPTHVWEVSGSWISHEALGSALGWQIGDRFDVRLRMGNPPQPVSFVTITISTPLPMTGSELRGSARGSWRLPTDTTQIIATFDGVEVVLQRQ